MNKKIAVINDLSGFGRCSLTAAISVISAMGVQPCPLPTAILSAQTGYEHYYCDNYTKKMDYIRQEWKQMGACFDGIYTGFVADKEQIDHIRRFVDTFYTNSTFLLVDPVMGDNGSTYDMFTKDLCRKMRDLAKQADIITPNLTELCLLADVPYGDVIKTKECAVLMDCIHGIGTTFAKGGPEHIIVTGIHFADEHGMEYIGNYYITPDASGMLSFPYIGESYSGTGDLFASCITAGIARGDHIPELIKMAGTFLEAGLKDSVKQHVPRNDGINFEKYLSMLIPANKTYNRIG